MTPSAILTAVRIGQSALRAKHKALDLLWRQFGAAVRQQRIKRGIPPKRFAHLLGVSAAMLGMMEMGKRGWKMKRAEKAARILNRPPQWPDQGRPAARVKH